MPGRRLMRAHIMKVELTVISLLVCITLQVEAASLGLNFVGSDPANSTLSAGMVAGIPGAQQSLWNNISSASTFSSNFTDNLTINFFVVVTTTLFIIRFLRSRSV